MRVQTVNNVSYQIIKLLGKGKGGYSYLALDGEKKVVLKQIHHEPCDYYAFGNKIESHKVSAKPCGILRLRSGGQSVSGCCEL